VVAIVGLPDRGGDALVAYHLHDQADRHHRQDRQGEQGRPSTAQPLANGKRRGDYDQYGKLAGIAVLARWLDQWP
jgi:hypothetical protein